MNFKDWVSRLNLINIPKQDVDRIQSKNLHFLCNKANANIIGFILGEHNIFNSSISGVAYVSIDSDYQSYKTDQCIITPDDDIWYRLPYCVSKNYKSIKDAGYH